MSIKYLSSSNNDAKVFASNPTTPWVRNPGWLTLPSVEGEQKFVGLYRIDQECNFASLRGTTSAGTYTVDWGDGTVENIASNTQANHIYNYDTYDTSNTTLVTHNGVTYKQAIITVTPTTANLTAINLALRYPGITTTVPGTYDSGWLDIAVNGNYLTACAISDSGVYNATTQIKHASLEQVKLYNNNVTNGGYMFANCTGLRSVPELNIQNMNNVEYMFANCFNLLSVPVLNMKSIGVIAQYMFYECHSLETINGFGSNHRISNPSSMFVNCSSLKRIPFINVEYALNLSNMFNGCSNITSIPFLETSSATNMLQMFANCSSLKTIPLLNTANVTDMSNMFQYCYSLINIPLLNTVKVTNMTTMFSNCKSLRSVPLLNTALVTNINSMFASCTSLHTVPQFNFVSAISANFMFQNSSIEYVPNMNLAVCTSAQSMFSGCSNLISVGTINLPLCTSFTSMFGNCYNLKYVGTITTPTSTTGSNFGSMFSGCTVLPTIPSMNLVSATSSSSYSSFAANCKSLMNVDAYGMKYTYTYNTNGKLGKKGLENIFTKLGLGTSQTLTITPNYGNDTPVVATVSASPNQITLSCPNTSGLAVGMYAVGTSVGPVASLPAEFNVTTNNITPTTVAFTMQNGDIVSVLAAGITNLASNTLYYVVNATPSTFEIALTPGGATIDLTGTTGTYSINTPRKIVSIDPNVSVTLDKPTTSNTITNGSVSFSYLNIGPALMRNWTVTR